MVRSALRSAASALAARSAARSPSTVSTPTAWTTRRFSSLLFRMAASAWAISLTWGTLVLLRSVPTVGW